MTEEMCPSCNHREIDHLSRDFHAGENRPRKIIKLCRRWGCLCGHKEWQNNL